MDTPALVSEVARQDTLPLAPPEGVRRLAPTRWLAIFFSLAVIGATLAPIVKNWQARPTDSFPFSYYPMFSDTGTYEEHGETYLVGLDGAGRRYIIHYSYIAPGGRLVRVRQFIRRMVRRGQAAQLCRSTGSEIARRNVARLRPVTNLQVVTGRFDLADYLAGNKTPRSEDVHAACEVRRRTA